MKRLASLWMFCGLRRSEIDLLEWKAIDWANRSIWVGPTEHLSVKTEECMGRIWVDILDRTWKLGELFCLGLHPERTTLCQSALLTTLKQAVSKRPQVWLTTLEEIATWWLNRTRAKVTCTEKGDRLVHVSVRGPKGVVILSRGVQVEAEIAEPWLGGIRLSQASELDVRASCRPFIGVTPSSAPRLKNFLRQQGYIVEETDCSLTHAFVLDRPRFDETDERALLEQIDQGDVVAARGRRQIDGDARERQRMTERDQL